MEGNLYITIPLTIDELNNGSSLPEIVSAAIMDNQNSFLPLLERLIDLGDDGMTVIDNSLKIENCDIDTVSSEGFAFGMFESDFFAGCKGLSSQDAHKVKLPFTIENNTLIFNLKIPPVWNPV